MHCLVVLLACIAVVSAVEKNECVKLVQPNALQCCKKEYSHTHSDFDLVKECTKKSQQKTCDIDICIAKAKGFGSDDGKISDMKALEAILEKDFEKYPETVVWIKKECINNDLSKYAPPDFCEVVKMRLCVQYQMLIGCPDFSDEGSCKGFKELVEKCMDE